MSEIYKEKETLDINTMGVGDTFWEKAQDGTPVMMRIVGKKDGLVAAMPGFRKDEEFKEHPELATTYAPECQVLKHRPD